MNRPERQNSKIILGLMTHSGYKELKQVQDALLSADVCKKLKDSLPVNSKMDTWLLLVTEGAFYIFYIFYTFYTFWLEK